jgi:Cu/Ag efflux pump CusA
MIDRFVEICFNKRVLVGMMALFFCVYGVYAWIQLPVDAYRSSAMCTPR